MNLFSSVITIIILIALMGLLGSFDRHDSKNKQSTYCEMVTLYKTSGGTDGWPDFDRKYSECP